MVEWNVHDPSGSKGAAGMWDSHIIIVRFSVLTLIVSLTSSNTGRSCRHQPREGPVPIWVR